MREIKIIKLTQRNKYKKTNLSYNMNILTCGCFDLIHLGHIDFLNKIKGKDDKLFVLVHSDRYISTYKRKPIINENDRLKMILNIKCVDEAFIDDNDYLSDETIKQYNINSVYHAVIGVSSWKYYFNEAEKKKIMNHIEYDTNNVSTTEIINKINTNNDIDYDNRYTKENILKSEKLYGTGFQSPGLEMILNTLLPNKELKNILEIGSGLGGNCLNLYNKYKCDIIGLDICEPMIEICNERKTYSKIKYILEDYNNYNVETKFDLILCRDVFLYLNTEQLYQNLQKIKSQLTEDGTFILIDYCFGEISNKDFTDYCMNRNWNLINVSFYKKLINDAGLTVVDDNSLSQEYISYFENKELDIEMDVKENLNKKIGFLKEKSFDWHYFIVK
tara:strand:+ start:573 stop:1739 length:1167 start_codon:yes stop_codon:yes gene_type:complete